MWGLSELLQNPGLIDNPLYLQKYESHENNINNYSRLFNHYIYSKEDAIKYGIIPNDATLKTLYKLLARK